jgi:hypothetical protein
MDDVLELVDKNLSICVWQLPSEFPKQQLKQRLKDYFEGEKKCQVNKVVPVQEGDANNAVILFTQSRGKFHDGASFTFTPIHSL